MTSLPRSLSCLSNVLCCRCRHVPGNIYKDKMGGSIDSTSASNELVIRIQPKESIYLKINNKVPGLGLRLDTTKLDLQYQAAYDKKELPDAYERLLLDVVNGEWAQYWIAPGR